MTSLYGNEPFFVTLNLFQGPLCPKLRAIMRQERQPCAYILASGHYGTLYIGVTSNLAGRLWQHCNGTVPGFTQRYAIHRLVHFELFDAMDAGIAREKQLKRWHRQWEINLINETNPEWANLAVGLGLPPLELRVTRNGS